MTKKKILSLLLALVMILDLLPRFALPVVAGDQPKRDIVIEESTDYDEDEDYITGMVRLSCEENGSQATLEQGDKIYVFTNLDPSLGEEVTYLWQMMTTSDEWATISGLALPYAAITDALLTGATREDGTARLRCIVGAGEQKYVSQTLVISRIERVTQPEIEAEPMAVFSSRATGEDTMETNENDQQPTTGDDEIIEDEIIDDGTGSDGTGSDGTDSDGTDDSGGTGTGNSGSSSSGSTGAQDTFQITINYIYHHLNPASSLENLKVEAGTAAANAFTVTLPGSAHYTGTIATPLEVGYLPYVHVNYQQYVTGYVAPGKDDNSDPFPASNYITHGGQRYVLAQSIQFDRQIDRVELTVYYIPQKVSYQVRIFEQNLYDDEYTLVETQNKEALANAAVGTGLDGDRTGFEPLYYIPDTPVAEDGSSVLDIYYDRIYYLVDFNLNIDNDDKAYGVVNHYVRYQTPVTLPTPTRPGYSFLNWELVAVNDGAVTATTYEKTPKGGHQVASVEHKLNYKANWAAGSTSYTIIYWLENAEDSNFSLDSFEVVEGVSPGAVVSASDSLKIEDKNYFIFSEKLSDKDVTVAADGTTALNVYYLRAYYTLAYNGSAVCVTQQHTHDATCNSMGKCTTPSHSHTAVCGAETLICKIVEHTHTSDCCTIAPHEHSTKTEENPDGCCDKPYHVHTTSSGTDCEKQEHPVHHDQCYSTNGLKEADSLTNNNQTRAYTALKAAVSGMIEGYVYRIRYSNTTYNFLYTHEKWFYLGSGNTYNGVELTTSISTPTTNNTVKSGPAKVKCGQELHVHGDGNCYCKYEEHDHTSGCTPCDKTRHVHNEGNCICKEEKETHTHIRSCYSYDCGKPAHTHTAECARTCQKVVHTHNADCQTKKTQNFLTVNCKYDSDISSAWTTVDTYFPNGERWKASDYFNEVLVYVPYMPPTSITFTVDAQTRKEFTMNYYLEALDPQGEGVTEYNKKFFNLKKTTKAQYNYLTEKEDFLDFVGFTQWVSNPAFSGGQVSSNTNPVNMYYTRNEYQLEFVSMGAALSVLTKTLKYEQPIDASYEVLAQDVPYPSTQEAGAIRFVGWYTTPTCAEGTEFVFDGKTTMPLGGLVLYAKWETCSYTVNVYASPEDLQDNKPARDPQSVLFGSFLAEPDHHNIRENVKPPAAEPSPAEEGETGEDEVKELIFAGWYYKKNGKEIRFDFNTMPVKEDMDIYAKWTSRIPVNFTIHYVYRSCKLEEHTHVDECYENRDSAAEKLICTIPEHSHNGEIYQQIAAPVTGKSLAGVSKTFYPKVDTELDQAYREGYFPEMRVHTMTMSEVDAENVYYFVYTDPDTITYTVTHKFTEDATAQLADGQTVTTQSVFERVLGVKVAEYTIEYTISGEMLDRSAATVLVSFREGLSKDRVINALAEAYGETISDTDAKELWEKIVNLSPDAISKKHILTTGTGAQANQVEFYWSKQSESVPYTICYYYETVDGTDFYLDTVDQNNAAPGTEIDLSQENAIQVPSGFNVSGLSNLIGEVKSLEYENDEFKPGLVLNVYYTRIEYRYTISYINQATYQPIDGVTNKTGTAKYGTKIKVSDVAIDIPGYTLNNGDMEYPIAESTESISIVCYYTGLEVTYVYQVSGAGGQFEVGKEQETLAIGTGKPKAKTVALWSDGYVLYRWYYVVDGVEKEVSDDWLSEDRLTIHFPEPGVEHAGKTVYIYAEVIPATRRFRVEGFQTTSNDPQAFVFRLTGNGINLTFFIMDTGYLDIECLPYGEYTLTTLNWAWRYQHPDKVRLRQYDENGDNQEIVQAGENGVFILNLNTTGDVIIHYDSDETHKETHWLSDDAVGVIPVTPYTPTS